MLVKKLKKRIIMARPQNLYETIQVQVCVTPEIEKLIKLQGILRGNSIAQEIVSLALKQLSQHQFNVDENIVKKFDDMSPNEISQASSFADRIIKEKERSKDVAGLSLIN